MGFEEKWVDLIKACVETVSYSLMINRTPQQPFHPSRGLRQGDPLSPYLFILCSEILGRILNKAEEKGYISVYFSRNTRIEAKDAILSGVRLSEARSYEKYLGLPSYVGRQKVAAFRPILESIRNRMSNWKWGSREEKTKTQWIPWKQMGKSKREGGLGYRDFEDFNLALLAKQGWRIIQNPSSLAARVLKAKYFFKSDFLKAKVGSNVSFLWRSFLEARPILQEELFWRIGNGDSVNIWTDKWLPRPSSFKVQSLLKAEFAASKVSALIDSSSGAWKMDTLREVFRHEEVEVVCRIPKLKVRELPFKELCKDIFDVLDDHSTVVFAETVYMIWRRRNNFVFENRFMDPNELVKTTNQKADWDASVDRIKSRIGIGVIIRDWNGVVVATLKHQRESFPNSVVAKTLGALKAVSLCQQLLLDRVILEGDAKVVVDDINCDVVKWNSGGMIIQDIKHKLSSMGEWSVQFIPRNINTIAHILAKDALKLS
ncbi:uncharacterized protein LOC122282314 [Carya illinoinensis]|uniref:uncharacterized protein LOC122282314 n=1 Tax=Carya illinoinensis TaxID=32201 RepID=UPI001C71ACEA|nr:uncharacterized protein LOC122282314 [Carya illinoinensis]